MFDGAEDCATVMAALMQMKTLDIAAPQRAYER
jgi:hypothetical protein